MSITCNTFGLRSINTATFNANQREGEHIPEIIRNQSITLLRINNLVLNILGYIPVVAQISGSIRMGIGCSIIVLTLALGSPSSDRGAIIGRWYKEALITGIAQVARGGLEAFVPCARVARMVLDGIATVANVSTEHSYAYFASPREDEVDPNTVDWDTSVPDLGRPKSEPLSTRFFGDPCYPGPLGLLCLV